MDQRNSLEWADIHRELKQKTSIPEVKIPLSDGSVRECKMKKTVEKGIAQEILERFSWAQSAPICQGVMF